MRDAGSPLRLFFAVKPDPIERDDLGEAAKALILGPESRLVPRSNYHLTLAFVGEVTVSQLPIVREIGARQAASTWVLMFDAFEYWPKPEVVVAVARSIPGELLALWQQLHHELAIHQWALAPKRLRPHVTLARKVSQPPVLQAMSRVSWAARELCLMRSELSGSQPAYTVVNTWPLLYDSEKQ